MSDQPTEERAHIAARSIVKEWERQTQLAMIYPGLLIDIATLGILAAEQRHQAELGAVVEQCARIAQTSDLGDPEQFVKPIIMCNLIAARIRQLHPDAGASLKRVELKARLDEAKERANRWPPLGAVQDAGSLRAWIYERAHEQQQRIAALQRELESRK